VITLLTIITIANHDEKSISYSEVRMVEEGWSIRSDFFALSDLQKKFNHNSLHILILYCSKSSHKLTLL